MRLAPFLIMLCVSCSVKKQTDQVIQFDVLALLNARPVTVLKKNKLITWTKGIDGNGLADGYLTRSAAVFTGDNVHALPDNPLIPPGKSHPEIFLHYNNDNDNSNQARSVSGAGEFTIPVPANHYSKIYLGLTSAEGSSFLNCTLKYTNGQEIKEYILPDYYNNVDASDSNFTYLCTDLAKWDKNNIIAEKNHHNIHLLIMKTEPQRQLTGIVIKKSKQGYLVFWSATGMK